jgi:uncharacterized repeat protein (TIGR01451 family)
LIVKILAFSIQGFTFMETFFMKTRLSLVLIFLLMSIYSQAQVSSINFLQSMDTFQLISGTQVDMPNEDDIFHPNIPIGFAFTYNGNATNKIGICTNGFIVMDSLMHSGLWLFNTQSTNQVNVFMSDLRNTNAGGSIEYVTVGTAPNRVCIIQWKDYGIFGIPYCHLNFQIRLHEGSNCIQFYYGTNALAGNTGQLFHVGLTGNSTLDYNLRTTPSNWLNSSPSLAFPGNGMFLNPLSTLPSGLVFSFGSCPASGIPFSYITGNVFNDINNNGSRDVNETPLANILVHDNTQNFYTTTDTSGNYALFFLDSNSTYSLQAIPQLYWTISSTPAMHNVTPISQPTQNRDFGLHPTPNVHDVSIASTASSVPWPTANVTIFSTYHNMGTVVEPGDSIYFVKDSHYSFTSSNPTPAYVSGDSIVWTYTNLLINEYRNISMQLQADSTIQAGDTLHSFWTIKPLSGDTNILNNHVALHQPCVSSFDPNSKSVYPDGDIENGQELTYTIHFQNTGTAPALNVFLHDTLDANLDVNSFQLKSFSHPVSHSVTGSGILEFTFANIYLPDSTSDEPMSHGHVTFSIKPKPGLMVNTQLHNTASIVFDFNSPIVTNTTLNTITEASPNGTTSIQKSQWLANVYPNPTSSTIYVHALSEMKDANITLYDFTGKVVMQKQFKKLNTSSLDLTSIQSGVYLLEIECKGQSQFTKLVKK